MNSPPPKILPYGKPCLGDPEIEAVSETLQTDWITQGPRIAEFEARLCKTLHAPFAVAVSNATSALHLALRVAGIGPGDRVVTSPLTFLASANAALYVGAIPDFCDIHPHTLSLDPEKLEANWKSDTRAVVAVDYAGIPCNIAAIAKVAHRHGAILIEDACHGFGGMFHGPNDQPGPYYLGANPWCDFSTFSFHAVKTITTGEGGVLFCKDQAAAQRAQRLRSHGVERHNQNFHTFPNDDPLFEQGPWYYEMQELGFNYRITDFQCALGMAQLDRLQHFLQRRREIVNLYRENLAGIPLIHLPQMPKPQDEPLASWHIFPVRIEFDQIKMSRSEIMLTLRSQGIGTQVHYIPVHLQPYYRKTFGYGPGLCPVAENYYRQTLSLPLYPELTNDQVLWIAKTIRSLLKEK